jgi:hypothetical protein
MSIKAEVKAATAAHLAAQGVTLDPLTFDKAWAKYGREAANYGQSAAERVDEDSDGVQGAALTVLAFYRETVAQPKGGQTYNQKRAREYGKSITHA